MYNNDLKKIYPTLINKLEFFYSKSIVSDKPIKTLFKYIFTFKWNKIVDFIKFKYRNAKLLYLHKNREKEFCKNYIPNYFSEDRFVVYTSIFGDYDKLEEPVIVPDNCDFRLITDTNIDLSNSVWKKVDINMFSEELQGLSNSMKNRYFKFHPDKVFPEYKSSVYIDGNIKVVSDLTEYINLISDIGFVAHEHRTRDDVFQEIDACLIFKKGNKRNILEYKKFLYKENMPNNYGLIECNILVRNHHNEMCKKIMHYWWQELGKGTGRDQLILPYVLYRMNIKVSEVTLMGKNAYKNKSFHIMNHK